ncbi:restriction endonuclease subunit S [Staphylococcus epidermidis]|uniref:restriction endonuclease subunit S n=1 Tax=Staphylococcus epidermidis TaxID=1282 RepID=UPI0018894FCE|nr:restriction endonuclease subunit S [Staphylococcus epidermidis]MBF2171910.1 restriction endonuclease subunit S [Staphylococcus epidermidis]
MTKHTNTPELRFPEFKDIWYIKQLEEIGTFKNGINKDKNSFGHGFPFINLNDVFNQDNINIKNLGLIDSSEKEREEYNLTKGDTLFIRSSVKPSGVGLTKVIQNDLINTVYSGFLIRFRERKKFLEDNFKSYIFSSTSARKQIISLSSTSANTNINQDSLKKVQIVIPPLIEQEKIGYFFSKLDQQIELEEKKLELLEQQKRGYMQKIFSQEMRFKDENNNSYPDWEIKKLEEIAEFQNGKAHENFVSNTGKFILVNSKFISTESKVKKYVDKQLTPLEINDIAIVMSDVPNGKALAKCYLIEKENTYSLNQRIGRIFNIEGNSRFLYTQINRNKQLLKYDSGVGQTNLKKSEIIGIKIYWPNKEEQNKIGAFFLKLDSIIEKQSTKLELLKHRKKGLLQKMFV